MWRCKMCKCQMSKCKMWRWKMCRWKVMQDVKMLDVKVLSQLFAIFNGLYAWALSGISMMWKLFYNSIRFEKRIQRNPNPVAPNLTQQAALWSTALHESLDLRSKCLVPVCSVWCCKMMAFCGALWL
jgi:hypothetical protein